MVIFTDDHVPAHVHVFGSGEAKIDLHGPNDAPVLVSVVGMTRTEVRKAMQIVTENRESLIVRWRSIHG